MLDGISFCFQFKNLIVGEWKEWKDRRIGRLLPPYLTRLQQRYSAYLQRPGLTKIPKVLLPLPLTEAAVSTPESTVAVSVPEQPATSKEGSLEEGVKDAAAPSSVHVDSGSGTTKASGMCSNLPLHFHSITGRSRICFA